MSSKIKEIWEYINETWSEVPWIRAAGILAGLAGGLLTLNSALPDGISIEIGTLETGVRLISLGSLLILYFFLVAVFSGDRLRFEKKLRSLEQSFKYDKRGTLFNGREPNIAFRIATFQGILSGIASSVSSDTINSALFKTGTEASVDFASNLESIYNEDVAGRKASKIWSELTLKEKLAQWAEYDSSTGWGILACSLNGNNVKVVINHLHGLYDQMGGKLFSQFLAGYAQTIIGHVLLKHETGKYQESEKAELLSIKHNDKYTVEMEFKLI